jgi:hypothetical protein
MFRSIRLRLKTEGGSIDWPWLFCLLLTLFAIQGAVIVVFYLIRGVDTPPEALPLGLQLDFVHGIIHLVTGCLAALFSFRFPAQAPILGCSSSLPRTRCIGPLALRRPLSDTALC